MIEIRVGKRGQEREDLGMRGRGVRKSHEANISNERNQISETCQTPAQSKVAPLYHQASRRVGHFFFSFFIHPLYSVCFKGINVLIITPKSGGRDLLVVVVASIENDATKASSNKSEKN